MTLAETETRVGSLLKGWRKRRRLTQLQLAVDAEVSARHLSFVETGRSRPTPAMIDRLAGSLDVPLRIVVDGEELSFFSIAAAVVSATDVTVDDLHIEAFYPADAATARALAPA